MKYCPIEDYDIFHSTMGWVGVEAYDNNADLLFSNTLDRQSEPRISDVSLVVGAGVQLDEPGFEVPQNAMEFTNSDYSQRIQWCAESAKDHLRKFPAPRKKMFERYVADGMPGHYAAQRQAADRRNMSWFDYVTCDPILGNIDTSVPLLNILEWSYEHVLEVNDNPQVQDAISNAVQAYGKDAQRHIDAGRMSEAAAERLESLNGVAIGITEPFDPMLGMTTMAYALKDRGMIKVALPVGRGIDGLLDDTAFVLDHELNHIFGSRGKQRRSDEEGFTEHLTATNLFGEFEILQPGERSGDRAVYPGLRGLKAEVHHGPKGEVETVLGTLAYSGTDEQVFAYEDNVDYIWRDIDVMPKLEEALLAMVAYNQALRDKKKLPRLSDSAVMDMVASETVEFIRDCRTQDVRISELAAQATAKFKKAIVALEAETTSW